MNRLRQNFFQSLFTRYDDFDCFHYVIVLCLVSILPYHDVKWRVERETLAIPGITITARVARVKFATPFNSKIKKETLVYDSFEFPKRKQQ